RLPDRRDKHRTKYHLGIFPDVLAPSFGAPCLSRQGGRRKGEPVCKATLGLEARVALRSGSPEPSYCHWPSRAVSLSRRHSMRSSAPLSRSAGIPACSLRTPPRTRSTSPSPRGASRSSMAPPTASRQVLG